VSLSEPSAQVSAKAERWYHRLKVAANHAPLKATARELASRTCTAYSYVVTFLRELEAAGWIERQQAKHGPTEFRFLQHAVAVAPSHGEPLPVAPAPEQGMQTQEPTAPDPLAVVEVQSSEFRVQSSKFRVQSSNGKASEEVRTGKDSYAAAASNLNFELLADFRNRLTQLLAEFDINGRKRTSLVEAITALVARQFGLEKAQDVLAEVRRGLEHAKAKQAAGLVQSAAAVGTVILADYAETGQMHLFPIPSSAGSAGSAAKDGANKPAGAAERRSRNGRTYRHGQVIFTDEQRQQAEAEAKQRLAARNAAREAREAQKVATS